MKRSLTLILGVLVTLSGCTMVPKYTRPEAPVLSLVTVYGDRVP